MESKTIFSLEFSSGFFSNLKDFVSNLKELKNSKKQTIIVSGIGISLCLFLMYKLSRSGKKEKELTPAFEKDIKETIKEEIKEEKEKTGQINNNKSNNSSMISTGKFIKNLEIKSSTLLKNSMKSSKITDEDVVYKLPSKNNPSSRIKEKHIFRDYTSFEEDAECDSLSTKEEKSIYHRKRGMSYSTDYERDYQSRQKKNILSMAKEATPSDQLFFKLYANLANDN